MLVVDIVVTHVEVDHLVLLVRPHDGIVPTVPDLAPLRAGAKREARRVYGKQNVDVWILPEIFFPSVPLVRRRPKRLGEMVRRRMRAVFDTKNRRRRSPGVADMGSRAEKCVVIPVSLPVPPTVSAQNRQSGC